MVLSMATFGARGETEKKLRTALALPSDNAITKTGFQSLVDSFKVSLTKILHLSTQTHLMKLKDIKIVLCFSKCQNYKHVELRLANKIYLANGFEPKADFKKVIAASFRSEAQSLDFHRAVEASKTINDWCEKQTNHRIKDLIKPGKIIFNCIIFLIRRNSIRQCHKLFDFIIGDLTADTALVLVNAVYFKGNWAYKFDDALTKPLPFHVDATTVKDVPTMFRSGLYCYGELPQVNAKFVELPYKVHAFF